MPGHATVSSSSARRPLTSLVLVLVGHFRRLNLDLGFRQHIFIFLVEFERSQGHNSFATLQALEVMCKGRMLADLVAVIGSIDIVLGEIDR